MLRVVLRLLAVVIFTIGGFGAVELLLTLTLTKRGSPFLMLFLFGYLPIGLVVLYVDYLLIRPLLPPNLRKDPSI